MEQLRDYATPAPGALDYQRCLLEDEFGQSSQVWATSTTLKQWVRSRCWCEGRTNRHCSPTREQTLALLGTVFQAG